MIDVWSFLVNLQSFMLKDNTNRKHNIYCFPCHFMSSVEKFSLNTNDNLTLANLQKQIISSVTYEMLFVDKFCLYFPYNKGKSHWLAYVAKFDQIKFLKNDKSNLSVDVLNTLNYYDQTPLEDLAMSLGNVLSIALNSILFLHHHKLVDMKIPNIVVTFPSVVIQQNSVDCGVFVMLFPRCILFQEKFAMSQLLKETSEKQRDYIARSLVRQHLTDERDFIKGRVDQQLLSSKLKEMEVKNPLVDLFDDDEVVVKITIPVNDKKEKEVKNPLFDFSKDDDDVIADVNDEVVVDVEVVSKFTDNIDTVNDDINLNVIQHEHGLMSLSEGDDQKKVSFYEEMYINYNGVSFQKDRETFETETLMTPTLIDYEKMMGNFTYVSNGKDFQKMIDWYCVDTNKFIVGESVKNNNSFWLSVFKCFEASSSRSKSIFNFKDGENLKTSFFAHLFSEINRKNCTVNDTNKESLKTISLKWNLNIPFTSDKTFATKMHKSFKPSYPKDACTENIEVVIIFLGHFLRSNFKIWSFKYVEDERRLKFVVNRQTSFLEYDQIFDLLYYYDSNDARDRYISLLTNNSSVINDE